MNEITLLEVESVIVPDKLVLSNKVIKTVDDNSFRPLIVINTLMMGFLPNGEPISLGGGFQTRISLEFREDIKTLAGHDLTDDELKVALGNNVTNILQSLDSYGKVSG